ncbi:Ubiquitin carboxyl-terminal hydrolase 47-like [Oopsacas minuta]|uniref:Ubiquitin carboxyl-terminal hydrolase 47-like n=1 Tax=Oopsacas minuta TaxID=111878 RepID=A0AAV7KBE8_9METZ|nr:Ubiquitin carboxyl-terminal hydrolase 47-like [Oopsacas minuta]
MAELDYNPKRVKTNSPTPYLYINNDYTHTSKLSNKLQKNWSTSKDLEDGNFKFSNSPFKHCILNNFFTELVTVNLLEKELKSLKLTKKNSDLLRLRQSFDLSNYKDGLIGSFLSCLREELLYFISKSTGFDLEEISLSCANYSYRDYLLCHDDQLENRKIAFIYYLVPKIWSLADGGTLDVFTAVDFTPFEIAKSIVPTRNTLVFFEVSNISFHQVSEILSTNKSRLSLSGWFHSKNTTKEIPQVPAPIPKLTDLTLSDISILEPWINPIYLDTKVQFGIRKKFEIQSEIKLQDFILPSKFDELCKNLNSPGLEWEWTGSWNKERFQRIKSEHNPEVLSHFDTLLISEPYAILLSHLTGLKLSDNLQELSSNDSESKSNTSHSSNSSELKIGYGTLENLTRWKGGSYSLLNFTNSIVSQTNRLQSNLFVSTDKGVYDAEGFWSYIASEGEDELLRIEPQGNCLCLVYLEKGIMVKVYHVDLDSKSVLDPQILRAHQTMTVGEFKQLVEQEMSIPAEHMRILLERYYYELRILEYDQHLLKQEGFYRINKVFIEGGKFDDHLNPIENSQMYKVVDSHINAVNLIITLPSIEDIEEEKCDKKVVEGGGDPIDVSPNEPGSSLENAEKETDTPKTNESEVKKEETITDPVESKTIIGPEKEPQNTDSDLESARNKPKPRIIKINIDKRLTISDLKNRLEPEVGISTDFFKIIRVYTNLQEFEYTRLGDTLSSFVDDVKIVVRLGRALKPGEYRAKVYFLNVRATDEITKFLMDFIVSKDLSVKDAKLEILDSISRKKTEYIPQGLTLDNLRLRKKTWKNPGTIYFDDQYFDKDINVFNGSEIFVEMLEGTEPMTRPSDLQIYIRKWNPNSYTLDQFQEIIMNATSVDALKQMIAQHSNLACSNVEFAKGQGSFPCDISLLEIQEELDWNPSAMYLNTWPLYMHDDGSVIYYRDKTDTLMKLSDQRRQEIQKQETTRLQKLTNTSSVSWVKPKERALKIYVKDSSTTDTPDEPEAPGVEIDSKV